MTAIACSVSMSSDGSTSSCTSHSISQHTLLTTPLDQLLKLTASQSSTTHCLCPNPLKIEAMKRQGRMIHTLLDACVNGDEEPLRRGALQVVERAERATQTTGDASDWLCKLETDMLEMWTNHYRR